MGQERRCDSLGGSPGGGPCLGWGFGEHLNHFAVERRDIVRFAAGDQFAVPDYFFIDPIGARIF